MSTTAAEACKRKTFVLDTNVLLHDTDAMYNFADNKVSVPMAVIEELDNFKKLADERGRMARQISRNLDGLRKHGKLSEGVPLKNGGVLKIELEHNAKIAYDFESSKKDNRILLTAVALQQKGENVIFISKDINLRIKAEAVGLLVQDYEKSKVKFDELYTGWRTIEVDVELINKFYADKKLKWNDKDNLLMPNEFVLMKNKVNPSQSALGKYVKKTGEIMPLFHQEAHPWGLSPLNIEQKFALELLLCDDVNLVTLVGIAGTGKTLLSIACGLQKTVDEHMYRRLFICRPIIPLGRDIGFLPGTKEEKLGQWMGAIQDNLEFLIDRKGDNENVEEKTQYLFETGKIEIEALTYIRGRSLPKQYIIVDDAQNLTPHETKAIISRAGENTKVILTGDPYQIDNPYLDASSNGLTYLVERFKGQEVFGQIMFSKSERSVLAGLAAELL
ncbi:MAG: PhoH family protein [Elusimicrobiota bacterium]